MRRALLGLATAGALAFAACGTGASATPTAALPGASRSSGTTAASCSPDEVLQQVDGLLAGSEYDAHVLTIAGELTLSVWLVDPKIDPDASTVTLADDNREARERGLRTSFDLVAGIGCVRTGFAKINPMIVDARYGSWFIDFIPVAALAGLHNPTLDDLVAALTAAGSAPPPGRLQTPDRARAASGACAWTRARAAIQPYLGGVSENTAAYLIVGGDVLGQNRWNPLGSNDVGVEVQWAVASASDGTDDAVLARLGRIAGVLAESCPRVDSLEAFVVDGNGHLVVYARAPGRAIHPGATQLPRDAVQFLRPDASTPPEQ